MSQREMDPYLSLSKSFVVVHSGGDEESEPELFDVEQEEREIVRLTKLLEPDYCNQRADPQLTEVHLKAAISESLQDLRTLKRPLESLETVVADLVEFTQRDLPNHDSSVLDYVDKHARQLIEDLRLVEFRKSQLELLRESLHRSRSQPIDIHAQLCKKLSLHLADWNSKSLRQKFSQDQAYKSFRQRIWEASGEEGVMPPLKTFLQADTGEEDEDESSGDELEIAGGTQNYKCPLCLGYLNEPLVSELCNHSFCKACFEAYLQQLNDTEAPCPNSGCSKSLSMACVARDDALSARIRQFRRRQQHKLDNQLFDDRPPSPSQPNGDESKPLRLKNADPSQKKRRVIVDDDDD